MKYSFLNRKFKYAYWNVAQILLAVNLIVYILVNMFDFQYHGIKLVYWLSLIPAFVNHGYVWQFVTYMFVHVDFMHILFNMYALIMFGTNLEKAIGSREFLLFYFLTGILGGVFSYIINVFSGLTMTATIGASGAVYALMFLVSVLFPESRVLLFYFIPMKIPFAVLIFIVVEAMSQIMGTAAGIAHLVHLSSVFVAWIYCVVRFKISPYKVYKSVIFNK